jgi:hypothetical protein
MFMRHERLRYGSLQEWNSVANKDFSTLITNQQILFNLVRRFLAARRARAVAGDNTTEVQAEANRISDEEAIRLANRDMRFIRPMIELTDLFRRLSPSVRFRNEVIQLVDRYRSMRRTPGEELPTPPLDPAHTNFQENLVQLVNRFPFTRRNTPAKRSVPIEGPAPKDEDFKTDTPEPVPQPAIPPPQIVDLTADSSDSSPPDSPFDLPDFNDDSPPPSPPRGGPPPPEDGEPIVNGGRNYAELKEYLRKVDRTTQVTIKYMKRVNVATHRYDHVIDEEDALFLIMLPTLFQEFLPMLIFAAPHIDLNHMYFFDKMRKRFKRMGRQIDSILALRNNPADIEVLSSEAQMTESADLIGRFIDRLFAPYVGNHPHSMFGAIYVLNHFLELLHLPLRDMPELRPMTGALLRPEPYEHKLDGDFEKQAFAPMEMLDPENDDVKNSKKAYILTKEQPGGDNEVVFEEWMHKYRCHALKMKRRRPTNKRCNNYIVTGFEYCWFHLKHYFNLEIRQTELRDKAGERGEYLGVFAREGLFFDGDNDAPVFKKGEFIITYMPEKLSREDFDMRYHNTVDPPFVTSNRTGDREDRPYHDASLKRSVSGFIMSDPPRANVVLRAMHRRGRGQPKHLMGVYAIADIFNGDELYLTEGQNPMTLEQNTDFKANTVQIKPNPHAPPHRRYTVNQPPVNPILRDPFNTGRPVHIGQTYDKIYIDREGKYEYGHNFPNMLNMSGPFQSRRRRIVR